MSSANAPTRTSGAAQFSKRRSVSMPRTITTTWMIQNTAKESHSVHGSPAVEPALLHQEPKALPPSAKIAPPPIQVWMPNQTQATIARMTAGRLAPRRPKEARAKTGNGMP
jgi:hypothetical protein